MTENKKKTPAVIAREALRLLSARALAPTPENYRNCYEEIGGKDARPAAAAAAPAPVLADVLVNLSRLLSGMLPALGTDDDRFAADMADLLRLLQEPSPDLTDIRIRAAGMGHRAAALAEEQLEIRTALLKLLHLVLENVGTLTIDDQWMKGQVDTVLAAVAPPLTLRHLDDVERRVRDVMYKQAEARGRSLEAREELRRMLAEFIARLAAMSEESSGFEGRLGDSMRRIETARSLQDLTPLVKEVMATARDMTEGTVKARSQLQALETKVRATEAELETLHRMLDNASAQARHDPLTDVLNRKGLDESLESEIARMQRRDSTLVVAMLDLDDFKRLNDRLGHATGDAALVHLVQVARESLRPADTVARYGGEEFVILMPDTTIDQGVQAMTRLQRELTRRFFSAGEERVFITFSAGVAQKRPEESGDEAIRRADEAMYLAKRQGKNRVVGG